MGNDQFSQFFSIMQKIRMCEQLPLPPLQVSTRLHKLHFSELSRHLWKCVRGMRQQRKEGREE